MNIENYRFNIAGIETQEPISLAALQGFFYDIPEFDLFFEYFLQQVTNTAIYTDISEDRDKFIGERFVHIMGNCPPAIAVYLKERQYYSRRNVTLRFVLFIDYVTERFKQLYG